MRRCFWLGGLSILIFSLVPAQQQTAPGRTGPPPQPVYKLSESEKAQLQSKVTELGSLVEALKKGRHGASLLADVEIFHKAGVWLLEFPEHIFVEDDYKNGLAILDQGIERAKQLQNGQSPWMQQKGRRSHGFYSELDGSVQPYGLRIPASYDGTKPVRLYVWLHGRDQRLTESNFLTRFAKPTPSHSNPADEGQIQLDVYGRWNGMAYHFTGEADVFEAIEQVKKRYKIDENRILLRGFSMGGCGAWHLALHHPGYWAAAEIGAGTWPRRSQMPGFAPHEQGPLRIYENILDWSLNAFNLPLAGHGGEKETGTSSIPGPPPGTPTRGQLESSIRVREQLEKEGYPSEGEPYELHAKGTDATFYISKDTGHSTSPEVRKKLDAFLKKYGDRGRVSADHLRFLSYTTRYNKSHWVTFDRMEKLYERAEIDAKRTAGGKEYDIQTKNLARMTLREMDKGSTIRIDGQELKVKPAREIALEKAGGSWRVGGKSTGLHKVRGLQGPIDDAFLDPFLLVRPTGTPWNKAAHDQAMRMLARFDGLYAKNLRAHPRMKDDKDVTAADFSKYHVVLFGDPGSNRWIARLNGKLPVRWTRDEVNIAGQSFPANEHFPALIYPNPLARSKYVVLNTGMTFQEREFSGEYQMPRLGDYSVLKVKEGADWPDIAVAGLFDEHWNFPGALRTSR